MTLLVVDIEKVELNTGAATVIEPPTEEDCDDAFEAKASSFTWNISLREHWLAVRTAPFTKTFNLQVLFAFSLAAAADVDVET